MCSNTVLQPGWVLLTVLLLCLSGAISTQSSTEATVKCGDTLSCLIAVNNEMATQNKLLGQLLAEIKSHSSSGSIRTVETSSIPVFVAFATGVCAVIAFLHMYLSFVSQRQNRRIQGHDCELMSILTTRH